MVWTLSKKLTLLGIALFVLASLSIGLSFWISWKLEGGAAAVNEAGRLRMQIYRLAFSVEQGDNAAVAQYAALFDKKIQLLDEGDATLPLFVPWDDKSRQHFEGLKAKWLILESQWQERVQQNKSEPIKHIPQQRLSLDKKQVHDFVADIDNLVSFIAHRMETWVNMLRFFQFVMMAIVLLSTIIVVVVGHKILIEPVAILRRGFDKVRQGDLSTRVSIEARDEFGELAQGFNQMTQHLQELYSGLEKKVAEKTAHLEEKQARLAALYEISSFIASADSLHALSNGFVERAHRLSGAKAVAMRWTDEANARYLLLAERGMNTSIRDDEACINTGDCYCGQGHDVAEFKTIHFNVATESERACVKEGYRAIVLVPIRLQHRLLGEMNFFYESASSSHMDDEQKTLMETLASHLASAMESLRTTALERESAVSEERSMLARELHDSIAQSLAFLKIQMGLLRKALAKGSTEQADKALQELDVGLKESYNDVRELLVHFRTRTNHENIDIAIQDTLQKFEHQSGVNIELKMDGHGLPLPADIQVQVLHIIQEALSNVRKHAKASRVIMRVTQSPQWSFEVEDNGCGFEQKPINSTHVGTKIMQERAQQIGGALYIKSQIGQGTRVRLELPPLSANHPHTHEKLA